MTLCSLVQIYSFREIYCLLLQGSRIASPTLKMVAAYTTETSANLYQSTWWHIYEDSNIHRHFNKDIKSCIIQNAITRFLYKNVFQIKHTCTTLYVRRYYTHEIFLLLLWETQKHCLHVANFQSSIYFHFITSVVLLPLFSCLTILLCIADLQLHWFSFISLHLYQISFQNIKLPHQSSGKTNCLLQVL